MNSTIALLIILAVAAGILYLGGDKIDEKSPIRKIIYFVLVVCAIVWFLTILGVLPGQISLNR